MSFKAAQQSMGDQPDNIFYDQLYHVTSSSEWGNHSSRYNICKNQVSLMSISQPVICQWQGHLVPFYLSRTQTLLLGSLQ